MNEWDEYASGWDDDPAVRAYADGVEQSLMALLGDVGLDPTEAAICDFGCGTGVLTERLAQRCSRVDAIDSSPAMLEVVRSKVETNAWRHVRTLSDLPSAHQDYDVIVCSSVLAFVADYDAMVMRLTDHLAPGGLFVQWDWELDTETDEPFGLERTAIRRALEHAGLQDVVVDLGFEVVAGDETMGPLMGSGRLAD